MAIAQAIMVLVEKGQELAKARDNVPSYTGQWSNEDYYAGEQHRFNRAAERLHRLLKGGRPVSYTMDQVKDAVKAVAGVRADAFDVWWQSTGATGAVSRAALKAFVDGAVGPEVDIIRSALTDLDTKGQFDPKAESLSLKR
jgi:hypothetical protein